MTAAKPIVISPYDRAAGVVRMLAQLPESHILYTGPVVCARHDFLSGMYAYPDKISYLCLSDLDVIFGRTEKLICQAAGEIMAKRGADIRSMALYTGCQNGLTGVDFESVMKTLRQQHGIAFTYYNMSRMPRSGNGNIYPGLYQSMFQLLDGSPAIDLPQAAASVNLLGTLNPFSLDNELTEALASWDISTLRSVGGCSSFADFQRMKEARLNLVTHTDYIPAAKMLERRFGIPWLFLPVTYSAEEISGQYRQLAEFFGSPWNDAPARQRAEEAVAAARELLRDAAIELDVNAILKPFSLTRFLLEQGFSVVRLRNLRSAPTNKRNDPKGLQWLEKHHPQLLEGAASSASMAAQQTGCPAQELGEARKPQECVRFGYAAVEHLMSCLTAEYRALALEGEATG